MAINNLKLLLFISCCLAFSLHAATSQSSPEISPSPHPDDISPSPQANHISLPPQPDGISPSPQLDGISPSPQANHISPSPQANHISLPPQPDGISPSPQLDGISPSPQSNHISLAPQPDDMSPSPQSDGISSSVQINHISLPPQPDDISPSPGPSASSGPLSSPSPGPASEVPKHYASYPSSISESPSGAISPSADGPSTSDNLTGLNISPVASSDAEPALKNICDATDHPDLCLSVAQPQLNDKKDVSSVLDVSVKGGIAFAQRVFNIAKEAAEKPDQDPEVGDILSECSDIYDNVVYNFEETLRVLPSRDIGGMNALLSAVITDIGDCDDQLKLAGAESPFSDYANKLADLTSNCLAIISLMN